MSTISFFNLLSEAVVKPTAPSITLTLLFPSLILLLELTIAPLPIAVAFVKVPVLTLA